MSGAPEATAVGDKGYAALLARFNNQPVGRRLLLPPPGDTPARNARDTKAGTNPVTTRAAPVRPSLPEMPAAGSAAVAQLRQVWRGFMAGSPGFGPERAGATVDGMDARQTFLDWRDACRAKFLSPLMCVEIACLGMNDGDIRYKMRNGTAQANMAACLDIYCLQRGW